MKMRVKTEEEIEEEAVAWERVRALAASVRWLAVWLENARDAAQTLIAVEQLLESQFLSLKQRRVVFERWHKVSWKLAHCIFGSDSSEYTEMLMKAKEDGILGPGE